MAKKGVAPLRELLYRNLSIEFEAPTRAQDPDKEVSVVSPEVQAEAKSIQFPICLINIPTKR